MTGSQVQVSGMKLFFVCAGGWGKARAGTLFCHSLGAETRGTLLIEASGREEREREREGEGIWEGRGLSIPAGHMTA